MNDRLQAAEEALRKVQAHVAALEGLSEDLSLSVHSLEAELGALREAPPASVAQVPALSADAEGARLVALNMALEGKPRQETGRYLAEHFNIADRDALLDDVYAAAER